MELTLHFDHGLGDCANFAHLLQLYKQRGYHFNLHCEESTAILFAPLDVNYIPIETPGLQYVHFPESGDPDEWIASQYWLYNKSAFNMNMPPLPDLGDAQELWQELCQTNLNVTPFIKAEHWQAVNEFLRELPRPIVLIHSQGNTGSEMKNVPHEDAVQIYRELLDRTSGTLVLLDWDNRVPRLANWRVRHMTDDWMWIDVGTLLALLMKSDLLVSVDSGPLHVARFTDIPVVGLFPTLNKHPTRVSLPRARSVAIVPRDVAHAVNRKTRILYNIVESRGGPMDFDPSFIAETSARMLAGPRYLSSDHLGADIQMQQFVLDWERSGANGLTQYIDRHRGWDVLLQEMHSRFSAPLVVETGCIRGEEDWQGAGFGTYLLGAYLCRQGGEVVSVDIDPDNCAFARQTTRELPNVTVVNDDSVGFLRQYGRRIDVLFLDSVDTEVPGMEEHCLREIQAAFPLLHEKSIVAWDDTVYSQRRFIGKGALAVPWLLDQGWRILYSGYQTICTR